ncbi:MAG: hypothetical protein AAGK80_00920 [Pseudomonadota bacterium]
MSASRAIGIAETQALSAKEQESANAVSMGRFTIIASSPTEAVKSHA